MQTERRVAADLQTKPTDRLVLSLRRGFSFVTSLSYSSGRISSSFSIRLVRVSNLHYQRRGKIAFTRKLVPAHTLHGWLQSGAE